MNIDLHILTWNESDIIRLVLRHYKRFCRNLYVYDNFSTDNTRDIARDEGAIISTFGTMFFDDAENMKCKNSCWLGSDADFVIVCDADELLFSNASNPAASIVSTLRMYADRGTTIAKTIGWQIMSNEWPVNDLTEITNGFRFDNYSKSIVFNPKEIAQINYGLGAHDCNPTGNVDWSGEGLMVLHYKHIGGLQRTIDRYRQYQPRMSKFNRKHGHGFHYNRSPASLRQEWNERMAKSRPLI